MTDDSMITAPATPLRQRSGRRIGAVAVLAVLTLGACTSDPGPRRVAQDIIKAEALDADERGEAFPEECMLEVVEGLDDDQLEAISEDLDSSNSETKAAGEAELADFQSALDACNN